MRRFIRCAFAGLLAVALVASGSVLGYASRAAAQTHHAMAASTEDAHAHHRHAQHADAVATDDSPQPSHDHASKTCCSMCVVASPLPPVADGIVRFQVSPALYASERTFGVALTLAVDPGIPKRTG
jgi:hypothetical protein